MEISADQEIEENMEAQKLKPRRAEDKDSSYWEGIKNKNQWKE